MTITTETVTVSAFNKMWINSTLINFLSGGSMFTRLQPYDGSYTLSTIVHSSVRNLSSARATDTSLNTVLTNLEAECRRQASQPTAELVTIAVSAPKPSQPVVAIIMFKDKPTYRIYDCFKLATTDATFRSVFNETLAELAKQSGYIAVE